MMQSNDLAEAVREVTDLAEKLGYPVNPPYQGTKPIHAFSSVLDGESENFWSQYFPFLSGVDGFSIDGYSLFGLDSYRDEKNGIIEYNKELASANNTEGTSNKFILIGTSGTDWYVYNLIDNAWESRDRIAVDEVYESFTTLTGLIKNIMARIKDANDLT